jgi:hypothetical protein
MIRELDNENDYSYNIEDSDLINKKAKLDNTFINPKKLDSSLFNISNSFNNNIFKWIKWFGNSCRYDSFFFNFYFMYLQ